MKPSLTVFICGTYRDLVDERAGVLDVVTRLRHQHDSMEFFGARPDQPIETCLDEVRRSDILVVIVGHLYGSIVSEIGISFTEAEYREGYRLRKPCLVYLRSEDVPILPRYMERDSEKIMLLREFKDSLRKRHTVATFKDAHDLSVAVAADLSRMAQEWEKASNASVQQHIDILLRGVDVWNTWRINNPETIPDLSGADLKGQDLSNVNFRKTKLIGTSLRETALVWSNLAGSDLSKADLGGAFLGETIFSNTNLKDTKGLELCIHAGSSPIDNLTLGRSWPLPVEFLRGCGLEDEYIKYLPRLFNIPSTEFNSCIISYSHKEKDIARRLYSDLQDQGVRCWFAPKDMNIENKIHEKFGETIKIHDRLLLILSEDLINNNWVKTEVESALEREKMRGDTVLFPIRVDDAVMGSELAWTSQLRGSRHIGDFREWKDDDAYQQAFQHLLRDFRVR